MKFLFIIILTSFMFCKHSIEIISYDAQFKNIGAGSAILKTTTLNNKNEKEILFSFKSKKSLIFFINYEKTY